MQDSVRNKITVGLYVTVIFLMILGMSYAYTIASVATNVNASTVTGYTNATYDYALIYDRAITASEVADNFSNNELVDSEINKKDLVAYYDFNN